MAAKAFYTAAFDLGDRGSSSGVRAIAQAT